ncbi:MAG: biopolymer transporter ExbD [Cyanobacteria bacterium J06626_18]
MRFRQRNDTPPPQVDLIPMLTVMMGVLAFFVVVTITLGTEQLVDMQLPAAQPEDQPPAPIAGAPFIVELDASNSLRLNNDPIDKAALKAQLETYLEQNPDNKAYLLPNRNLPYEEVIRFLGEMRAIGGDRVSLAIEE